VSDKYYTPDDLAVRLARIVAARLPGPRAVCDPHCGGGAMIRAAAEVWPKVTTLAYDTDPDAAGLELATYGAKCYFPPKYFEPCAWLCNPPYESDCGLWRMVEVLGWASGRATGDVVGALLPLDALAGQDRHRQMWQRWPLAEVHVLTWRPKFTGPDATGQTGKRPLAWFVWDFGARPTGRVYHLMK
jgi:hypothetical protein